MYYRARYYDPTIGRFISQDPFSGGPDDARVGYENDIYTKMHGTFTLYTTFRQPNAFNRYVYVQNNPLKYTDPLGLVAWKKAAKAAFGMVVNGLGLAAGVGAGLVPEPTGLSKIAAVIVTAKSATGLQLNAHNFGDALFDDGKNQRMDSLFGAIAESVAPGNENAQKLADVVDLSTDIALGISVGKGIEKSLGKVVTSGSITPSLERAAVRDPTDLGSVAQAFQGADAAGKVRKNFIKERKKQ